MPVGPIGPLAPLPSPTEGQMPANNMAGLAQAAGVIKQAMDQKKDKAKKDAQQQLPMLLQMAKAQPTNPQVQASLKGALQALGMPMPMTGGVAAQTTQDASQSPQGASMTAPGPTFQTPALNGGMQGGPRIPAGQVQEPGLTEQAPMQLNKQVGLTRTPMQPDLNALSPNVAPNEKQTEYLLSLPKNQRAGAAKTMQVAVDPDFLNAEPIFAPGSSGYNHAYQILQTLNTQAANGGITADQYSNALAQNKNLFQSAQIDTTTPDPAVFGALSRKAQADIDQKAALGKHYNAQDIAALKNATSLEELRKAQAKLDGAKAIALPMEDKMKWQHQKNQDSAAASRAGSYASRVTELNKQATSGNKAAIAQIMGLTRLADGDFKATQGALARAISTRDHLINDEGVDPTDPQMAEMNTTIEGLQTQLKQAGDTKDQMMKAYGGATGLGAQLHTSGLPNSSTITTKVDISKADQTATGANGKKAYHVNGAWVDENGKKL